MKVHLLADNIDVAQQALEQGQLVVLRTDTLYGILASAGSEVAVKKVYQARDRHTHKSCIILLASPKQAFGNDAVALKRAMTTQPTDTPTSYIISDSDAPTYLQHSDGSVAYRLPALPELHALVERTGPVIAPSANPQGRPPASSVHEAEIYFTDAVSLYIDDGEVPADTMPSRLVRVASDGTVERLR